MSERHLRDHPPVQPCLGTVGMYCPGPSCENSDVEMEAAQMIWPSPDLTPSSLGLWFVSNHCATPNCEDGPLPTESVRRPRRL